MTMLSAVRRLSLAFARRLSLALALAIASFIAWPAVALTSPTARLAASTPTCAPSNLRLDKIGEDDFTSHRGWIFALRNVGSRTCQLRGYPSIRLLNAHARPMPTTIDHFGGPAHTVVLASWHRAFFATTYAVSGPCSAAVFAYGMGITPPRASPRLVWYAGRFDLCGPAPAEVNVSPVEATRHF